MFKLKNIFFTELNAHEMLINIASNFDDFYPAIAISTLMRIIKDSNLSRHHTMAVQAIVFIFNCLGRTFNFDLILFLIAFAS